MSQSKSVTFASLVVIHSTINRDELLLSEKRAAWYSPKELKMMRRDCRIIASQLQNSVNTLGICTRGLERYMQRRSTRLSKRPQKAVFLQQEIQKSEGVDDHEEIADVYKSLTMASAKTALLRGILDHHILLGETRITATLAVLLAQCAKVMTERLGETDGSYAAFSCMTPMIS